MMNDEELRMTDEEVLRTMELLLKLWDKGGQEICEALLREDDDGTTAK
tara:strand:+ start:604 stop:747 length:144 start_codon:yes stop_codon:yes gene_type:complete